MAISDYKNIFNEYHSGPTSFVHILSKPVAPTHAAAIHQEDTDKLKEATGKVAKKNNTTLVFYGRQNTAKAIQLNQLAFHAKQSVCFIDCQRMVDKYIGETDMILR